VDGDFEAVSGDAAPDEERRQQIEIVGGPVSVETAQAQQVRGEVVVALGRNRRAPSRRGVAERPTEQGGARGAVGRSRSEALCRNLLFGLWIEGVARSTRAPARRARLHGDAAPGPAPWKSSWSSSNPRAEGRPST